MEIGPISDPNVEEGLRALLRKYAHVFAANETDVGCFPHVQMEIKWIDGAIAPHAKPYRMTYEQEAEVRRQVTNLLKVDYIRPSDSPSGARVILVAKKVPLGAQREWRLCIVFIPQNKITVKDNYPLPNVNTLLRAFHGTAVYSSLDMRHGFHHIEIREEDRWKTAFVTSFGQYEWNRMPFGLKNAPSVFQRAMDQIFAKTRIKPYLDDLLSASENEIAHLKDLTEAFVARV